MKVKVRRVLAYLYMDKAYCQSYLVGYEVMMCPRTSQHFKLSYLALFQVGFSVKSHMQKKM